MQQSTFSFGYIPDVPDSRDYRFAIPALSTYPCSVDLTPLLQPIKNQGKLGACTAFATTAMVEYVRTKQHLIKWDASPLFTYYSTRKIENTINQDSGAYVRDALKSVAIDGAAKEETWPYIIENFTIQPPLSAWVEALEHQALVYYRLNQTKDDVITCLADGYPFTFGVMLYQSFVDTQAGILVYNTVPMPNVSAEKLLGGHCMLAVGYLSGSDTDIKIIVRNSWGANVGLGGYHHMPIEYFLNSSLCMDMWTIRQEEIANDVEPEPSITPTSTFISTPTSTTATPTPAHTTTPLPILPTPEPIIPTPAPITPVIIDDNSIWANHTIYVIVVFVITLILFFVL